MATFLMRGLILLAATCGLAAPALGQDKTSPLPSHFRLRTEACFGRSYDAEHLRRHPKQRVTGFYLSREFASDPNAEEIALTHEYLLGIDGDNGMALVTAYVRFRDRPGLFSSTLACNRWDGVVRCSIDCDGGNFKLRTAGKSLLLDNEGFVVTGGCGTPDDEQEQSDFVKRGDDDRVFRLDPQPVAKCAALRDGLKPAWAKLGPPLRVRLDRYEAVCFSRSYDADHLRKHPRQSVRRIAVLKPEGGRPMHEVKVYRLTFRVELTDGRKFEKTTTCQPNKYAYGCTHDPKMDDEQNFYLTRAGDQTVMLRDRKGRLADLFGARLADDDRIFRLQASPASACTF